MPISTDNTETLRNALKRIELLESALAGAHRIIMHLRDNDSKLPESPDVDTMIQEYGTHSEKSPFTP